jgi:hypothetical protein
MGNSTVKVDPFPASLSTRIEPPCASAIIVAPAPVYSLKIASLNGGVTELMLFLMTEAPVQAPPGYAEEYRRQVDAA